MWIHAVSVGEVNLVIRLIDEIEKRLPNLKVVVSTTTTTGSSSTRSDTEVLVHLYEEKGADLVRELNGMFAFAIWDARRRRLLAARDHVGIKPFLWATIPDGLAFGSETGCFLDVPGVDRSIVPLVVGCPGVELDGATSLDELLGGQYAPDAVDFPQPVEDGGRFVGAAGLEAVATAEADLLVAEPRQCRLRQVVRRAAADLDAARAGPLDLVRGAGALPARRGEPGSSRRRSAWLGPGRGPGRR